MAYNDGSYIPSRNIARRMVVGPTKIGAAGCWEWMVQQQQQHCSSGATMLHRADSLPKKYILSNGEKWSRMEEFITRRASSVAFYSKKSKNTCVALT